MTSGALFSSRHWWLLVVLTAGYYASFVVFPGLFPFVGVVHFGVWFLDTFAILASNDALARGLNPYAPNPLDYFGRAHVYSHWWLGLGRFGLGRGDVFWLGVIQVGAFFVAAVTGLRPRSWGEAGWYLVVLCSSAMLLIVNRANNDLVVFLLLLPVVPCLLDRRRIVRLFPAFLIAVATGLKFYPAAAGLVLLAGPAGSGEIRTRVVVAALLLLAVGINLMPDLARMGVVVPKADGLMTFGLVNLLTPLGLAGAGALAATLGFVAGGVFLFTPIFRGWEIPAEHRADWLRFVMAASVLTGCYLTGTNYAYRWIFSLWLAPFLWRIAWETVSPPRLRKFARLTGALLVVMLWTDPGVAFVLTALKGSVAGPVLRHWADLVFLVEQPVACAFFACLLGWLAYFVRDRVPALLRRD
jgi:hypothetical protein